MLDMTYEKATDVLARAQVANRVVTGAPAIGATVGNDIEDALDLLETILTRIEERQTADHFPTQVAYTNRDGFGFSNVNINGTPVKAVQRIVVEHGDEEYSKVTLTLGGCEVSATVVSEP